MLANSTNDVDMIYYAFFGSDNQDASKNEPHLPFRKFRLSDFELEGFNLRRICLEVEVVQLLIVVPIHPKEGLDLR